MPCSPPPTPFPASMQDPEVRRRDEVSHHILRLAYASTPENQRYLIQYETAIFRARLERESPEQVSHFMEQYGLTFTPVRI